MLFQRGWIGLHSEITDKVKEAVTAGNLRFDIVYNSHFWWYRNMLESITKWLQWVHQKIRENVLETVIAGDLNFNVVDNIGMWSNLFQCGCGVSTQN